MDPQLKKGVLEMCILHCISGKEMYGYDIMQYMKTYFPDVNESTFYAILRRVYKDGAAKITYGEVSNGPKRKYYTLTEQGKQELQQRIEEYKQIIGITAALGILDENGLKEFLHL